MAKKTLAYAAQPSVHDVGGSSVSVPQAARVGVHWCSGAAFPREMGSHLLPWGHAVVWQSSAQ